MNRRSLLAALAAGTLALGCASAPVPTDYAAEKPVLALEKYFNGELVAHGIFTDRGGKVVRRFTVLMKAAGNALNWRYTLSLPVDGKVYEVQFDDWMYLMDERVMLNKAVMSKFGIRLGEVTLAFTKNP